MSRSSARIASPVGHITLVADDDRLVELRIEPVQRAARILESRPSTLPNGKRNGERKPAEPLAGVLDATARELEQYFAGKLRSFSIAPAPVGTAFEMSVWRELLSIGYGETATYRELAERIGRPGACRAVGMALRRNPIAIIVPCHRVIGASGSLTGYAAGLDTKRFLLELEARGRSRPRRASSQ